VILEAGRLFEKVARGVDYCGSGMGKSSDRDPVPNALVTGRLSSDSGSLLFQGGVMDAIFVSGR
jgi:hypothetical protein